MLQDSINSLYPEEPSEFFQSDLFLLDTWFLQDDIQGYCVEAVSPRRDTVIGSVPRKVLKQERKKYHATIKYIPLLTKPFPLQTIFSKPFKAEKSRLCDLFHFLMYACEDTGLMNLSSKSTHLSISWVQNMKVLHNRLWSQTWPLKDLVPGFTPNQPIFWALPYPFLSCQTSIEEELCSGRACRTCTAPLTLLQAEQQCHKDVSAWGHLHNQAGYTSTEGRQQKAQRKVRSLKVAWAAQNPMRGGSSDLC